MIFALLSLLCSLLIIPTAFLGLTILILPPLSLFFIYKSYQGLTARRPGRRRWPMLLCLVLTGLNVASLVTAIALMSGYRA